MSVRKSAEKSAQSDKNSAEFSEKIIRKSVKITEKSVKFVEKSVKSVRSSFKSIINRKHRLADDAEFDDKWDFQNVKITCSKRVKNLNLSTHSSHLFDISYHINLSH
jgi:hypothetical protein